MKNPIQVIALRKALGLLMLLLGATNLSAQGTWSQRASYGGDERAFGFAFVVDGKAYVGGGAGYGGSRNDEEMWAYDPAGNAWARKADLPLVPYRAEAMCVFRRY
jgi:N-acetylneuraminic acid mutarotase